MMSLVERGETSPTAVVLEKIATGLGCTLASLFDDAGAPVSPVSRAADRSVLEGPAVRLHAPQHLAAELSLADSHRRRRVSRRRARSPTKPARANRRWRSRSGCAHGAIEVTVGKVTHRLAKDDCLAMQLDAPVTFRNRTRKAAHYIVVLVVMSAFTGAAAGPADLARIRRAVRGAHRLRRRRRVGELHAADDAREGGGLLARRRRQHGARRTRAGGRRGRRGAIIGTAQAVWAQPENQPHRADVAKMLVHRRARRSASAPPCSRPRSAPRVEAGKTLLVLDTASADAERLYERGGWQRVGTIPDYALMPDGALCATVVYYKRLV